MSARSQALKAQNEQIVTFTLVELLTQLVFVAMLLAFVLRDEALQDVNPSAERLHKLEEELTAAKARIGVLEGENSTLREELKDEQERVRALLGTKGVTLPFGVKAITQEEYDEFASLKLRLQAKQKEIAAAQAEITALKGGKGGADLPNCLVTSGFLLDIGLLGDGSYQVTPAWDKGAPVRQVDGLSELTAGGTVSAATFNRLAARVHAWGLHSGDTPCIFKATVRRKHGNADLFERQYLRVSQSFYVAIRR